jgi:hypothetical protein
MSTVTLTSELEAINTMLDAAGESPVSSLSNSGLADVAEAIKLLEEQSRMVQSAGWTFNTEYEYPLAKDVDGYVMLPVNTLRVDADSTYSEGDTVQRGLRLYDRKNHTFVFPRNLTVSIVFLLAWDELPQAARQYIMIKAARIHQARVLGSDTLHKFSAETEMDALIIFKDAEGDSGDWNILNGSWSVANILDR